MTEPLPTTKRQRNQSPDVVLLDPDLVRRQRMVLGRPRVWLARSTGSSPALITNLENGYRQNHHTVEMIGRLATVLGVHPIDLIAPPPMPEPGDHPHNDDLAQVGQLLAAAHGPVLCEDLADHLKWTLPRVMLAIDQLTTHLKPLGQTIAWPAQHTVQLVPGPENEATTVNLTRTAVQRTGLSETEVTFIAKSKNATALQHSRLNKIAIKRLIDADLLTPSGTTTSDRYEVSDTMKDNMYLAELPVVTFKK